MLLYLIMLQAWALRAYFSLFIAAQLSSVASTGIEFRVIRDELGHVPHWQALLTASFLCYIREELAVNGRASFHHIHPEAGWVS